MQGLNISFNNISLNRLCPLLWSSNRLISEYEISSHCDFLRRIAHCNKTLLFIVVCTAPKCPAFAPIYEDFNLHNSGVWNFSSNTTEAVIASHSYT